MSKLKFIAACLALLFFANTYATSKTIVVKLIPKGEDATLSVLAALKEVRKTKATKPGWKFCSTESPTCQSDRSISICKNCN